MNGAEFAARLAQRHPGLPVLVVTGYAGGDLELSLPQLAKPFRQADLAAAIYRLVEPPAATNVLPFGVSRG
jgi:FixJ family two-component response regulator